MQPVDEALVLPGWRPTRWLVGTRTEVPPEIRASLVRDLYGSLPIFIGGVVNTIVVSSAITARNPEPLFFLWAGLELLLAMVRLPLLIAGQRAIRLGRPAPTDIYLLLGAAWAASVGFGSFISLTSGDWVSATLACLSAAAMVGGIAFRNFGAPRLVAAMILLSLGPITIGGLLSGQPLLMITALQIPMYMFAMTAAAYRLNAMMVRTMQSERDNLHLAQHDVLTGLLNRAGLEDEIERRAPADGEQKTTLFYVDLDGFKAVNDTFGHAAGDHLLATVGERLRTAMRPDDLVARIGGDEFVVIARHADRADAFRTGERIVAALGEQPYVVGDEAAIIGACVGVAMLPDHGRDFAALFAAADGALYQAKSRGRGRCAIAALPGVQLRLASKWPGPDERPRNVSA